MLSALFMAATVNVLKLCEESVCTSLAAAECQVESRSSQSQPTPEDRSTLNHSKRLFSHLKRF